MRIIVPGFKMSNSTKTMQKNSVYQLSFAASEDIRRVIDADIDEFDKLQLIGDICRLNALSAVKKAGSGHLGSSFSSIDIVVYLYFHEMNVLQVGIDHPDRDIYFSSKGHDCPGQYSVLVAAGILPFDKLLKLRRHGGLDGHPDIKIPGIEANSGSLGMGISKARGMALAKQLSGHGGRIFVMTGDGELQEGQIWESLQVTAHQRINNITVIVDYNKIQTDKPVKEIADLGNLEEKFRIFGWHVERCDGHDFCQLDEVFQRFRAVTDKPKVLIADTIKGKGVSFMEGPTALRQGSGLYRWHAGAPDDDSFETAHKEIIDRINSRLETLSLAPLAPEVVETREKYRVKLKDTAEKVVHAYGQALVDLARGRKDIVVLDADLAADCGLRPFAETFPNRFVECGIAEQDMVSMAGGLALQGYLPVVNSFGVFLASRANEQIYTNATEGTKIIYVCHYAGLIPAGPGKSHQSLRDISLFAALPGCVAIEPCNGVETERALQWCVNEAKETCLLRLVISPSPQTIELPDDYDFVFGKGTVLKDGKDAALFAYGPVLLHEALLASEELEKGGFSLKVIDMPWLNRVNEDWLEVAVDPCESIFVLDNHSPYGGLGDSLLNIMISCDGLRSKEFSKFAVEGHPACGTPKEALRSHGLDAQSLAKRIMRERVS
jgi:transketolase